MQSSRRNNFDFLRFAAAILVWYAHCCSLQGHSDQLSSFTHSETFGSLGVKIFFIISGYFITQSYERNRTILHYLKNRVLRIMPALCAVVLISICVIGPAMTTLPVKDYFKNTDTWEYLRCLLIFQPQYNLPGLFQHNPETAVNASLWTLPHEIRLYAVVAVLGILGILQPRLVLVLLATMFAIRLYGVFIMPGRSVMVLFLPWERLDLLLRLASEFALGSFLYLARDMLPLQLRYLAVTLAAAAGFIFFLHVVNTHRIDTMLLEDMVCDAAFAYALIYFGFAKLPVLPSVSRFGDFSYGFYLYAYPMQQICLAYLGRHPDFTTFLIASFTTTFLCAILSWYCIEKPALALK